MESYIVVRPTTEKPKTPKPKHSFGFFKRNDQSTLTPAGALCAKFIGSLGSFSGKMGAVVFSHNRAGTYVKRWVKPVNPNTAAQVNIRGLFQLVSEAWSGLTLSVRTSWQTLATSLGLPYGKALFQSRYENISIALQNSGTVPSPSSTPPAAIPNPTAVPAVVKNPTTVTIDLSGIFAGDVIPAGEAVELLASSETTRKLGKSKTIMAVLLAGASTAAPIDVSVPFIAKWGAPTSATKIGFALKPISNTNGIAGGQLEIYPEIPVS